MLRILQKIKIIYYSCEKINIMISSRCLLSILLLVTISSYSSAASCDANGHCKYGGRCGPGNQCICPMKCSQPTWKFDVNSLYCAARQGGQTKIFWNMCFVLAEACERQEDVPLIKFDIKKPYSCQATYENSWRLCSKPRDFMGPCGGTLNFGNEFSGGICLRDKETNMKRCECPPGKTGEDCQQKIIYLQRSVNVDNPEESSTACVYLGVSIGASIGAGVLLGMLMYALIRKCSSRRICNSGEHNKAHQNGEFSLGQNHPTQTSRVESELFASSFDQLNTANEYCVVSIVADSPEFTSTNSENFAASERHSKRQRLNGSSKKNSEDANNNLGSAQPRTTGEELAIGVEDNTQTRYSELTSTPEMGSDFTENGIIQRLSQHTCLQNEAYTI